MTRQLRALVVAYDFPPHGAIGTMRTLRLVQRLAADNWDVRVLTSDPRGFRFDTPIDDALLHRVPASVIARRAATFRGFDALKNVVRRVSRQKDPAIRPVVHNGRHAPATRSMAGRAIDFVDATLALPDNEAGWLVPAVAHGPPTCREWRPDVLYSSAPPWTGQVVAPVLAGILGCPWIADFRDPWARAPWCHVPRTFKTWANGRLEGAVIHRADAVLFVTRANLDEFAAFYGPTAAQRVHLIPNGCDAAECETAASKPRSDRFVLLHAGSLYEGRNPLPFIRDIAAIINRGTISRERFRLRLVGPIVLHVDLAAECRVIGLADIVEFVPRLPRRETLREMASASALLLLQPATKVSVPGKAYEYLAMQRPILAVAEEGETAELIRASGAGVSIRPDAGVDALERALLQLIEMASRPSSPVSLALYDGRVHAATAAQLLTQFACSGRHSTQWPDTALSSMPAVVPSEDRQR